ncbi:MAG: CPBP family intramembrane metalloprotease [Bacteroidales bacterium]|nr:CPBP family intramembrane metalloprotease [Bacteroidales bacterium]
MKKRGNYKFFDKFSYYIPGVGGMFALLALLLVGALMGSLLVMLLGLAFGQDFVTGYSNLISYPVMFIPPMIYASMRSNANSMNKNGRKLDNNHFAPVGAVMCAILAAAGTLATGFWSDGLVSLLPEMPPMLKSALEGLTSGNFWLNFITVSIFAPLFEEWLCRGMILRGLLTGARIKPAWAIVISAVFFALIHFNPWQAIPAFIIGCLLGYVYYRTGSIKLTMLMHFTNNTFALVCGHIDALKEMDSWMDFMPAAQYTVTASACFLLTILVALSFRKVHLEQAEGNIDAVPSIFETDEKQILH